MNDILDNLWLSRHPKDALFLSIIDGYTIMESNEYPDTIFYIKGERILIFYDSILKYCLINYDLIWSEFESKFNLNYYEIKELMIDILYTYLKIKETIPVQLLKESGL